MSIKILVYVTPKAALAAGKSLVGLQEVEFTDESLTALTQPERVALAVAFATGVHLGTDTDPEATEPTIAEVRRILAFRLSAQSRQHEEARLRKASLDKWIKDHGDDNQKERHREGLLPEEEALEAMRESFFDPLENNERYSAIRKTEACDCGCYEDVVFDNRAAAGTAPGLTATQFEKLKEIRELAPKGAAIETRMHIAKCDECDCAPVHRPSARVTLVWQGWTLTREYLL